MHPFFRFALALTLLFSAALLPAQGLSLVTNEREDGTVFFALDGKTGQVSFMVDYGGEPGIWKKYGNPIGTLAGGKFLFDSNERPDGSAFFAMESMTGQIYFMLDYGDNAGLWKKYGNPIGKDTYEFQANEREQGTAFFAMNATTGQMHFMLDYGDNAGNWQAYGGTAK